MWDQEKSEDHNHLNSQALLNNDDDNHHHPTAAIAMILTSWLSRRRIRYLFLALCSPLLLPFLCAAFPLLCAAEICLRICCRRRRLKATLAENWDGDGLRLCEEGARDGEVRLLQRYLDDQLILVVESVYDCGELDDGDEKDDECFDSTWTTPPLLP